MTHDSASDDPAECVWYKEKGHIKLTCPREVFGYAARRPTSDLIITASNTGGVGAQPAQLQMKVCINWYGSGKPTK